MKKYMTMFIVLLSLLMLPQFSQAQQKVSSVAHFYYYMPPVEYQLDSQGQRVGKGVQVRIPDMPAPAAFVQIEVVKDTVYAGMFHVNLNPETCTFNAFKLHAGMGFPLSQSKLTIINDDKGKVRGLVIEDATTRLTMDKLSRLIIFTYKEHHKESAVQSRPELYNTYGKDKAKELMRADRCKKVLGPANYDEKFDYLVKLLHNNW